MTKPIDDMNTDELTAHEKSLRAMLGVAIGLDAVFVGLLAYMAFLRTWNLTALIAGIPILLSNISMIRSLKGLQDIRARRAKLSARP